MFAGSGTLWFPLSPSLCDPTPCWGGIPGVSVSTAPPQPPRHSLPSVPATSRLHLRLLPSGGRGCGGSAETFLLQHGVNTGHSMAAARRRCWSGFCSSKRAGGGGFWRHSAGVGRELECQLGSTVSSSVFTNCGKACPQNHVGFAGWRNRTSPQTAGPAQTIKRHRMD